VLAPIFVFTYLAMIVATCLLLLDGAWRVAVISIGALAVSPVLNLVLVPWGARALGAGGAGTGAAIALLVTEASVAVALCASVGRAAVDRASVVALGKAAASCGATIAVDRALVRLGAARLGVDAITYVALLFGSGAVRPAELVRLARFLVERRRAGAAA
jgi:hypothetical protein